MCTSWVWTDLMQIHNLTEFAQLDTHGCRLPQQCLVDGHGGSSTIERGVDHCYDCCKFTCLCTPPTAVASLFCRVAKHKTKMTTAFCRSIRTVQNPLLAVLPWKQPKFVVLHPICVTCKISWPQQCPAMWYWTLPVTTPSLEETQPPLTCEERCHRRIVREKYTANSMYIVPYNQKQTWFVCV